MKKLKDINLTDYADKKGDDPHYTLTTGGTVIDQAFDEENHLHFVVRNPDGSVELTSGQNAAIGSFLKKPTSKIVFIQNGKKG